MLGMQLSGGVPAWHTEGSRLNPSTGKESHSNGIYFLKTLVNYRVGWVGREIWMKLGEGKEYDQSMLHEKFTK